MQYISLILIVVCMVVAIDSLPDLPVVRGAITLPKIKENKIELTSEDFSDLFLDVSSSQFREDRYQVLVSILMAHEISLEMRLSTASQSFEDTLERATALRKRLLRDGVPARALSLKVKDREEADGEIVATFTRKQT